ncbi:YggT family protein [Desulfitobacterium sp.]|uniref:YggT family protein n=1 Tax=Desulfitobacterium sp. TaxID=49981 RepID=UPI002B1F97EB|nr:YggT family protein [Desulfitobacterium sp.]MEA4900071.1 YggT family protein [Desulfitobacterium sp.]
MVVISILTFIYQVVDAVLMILGWAVILQAIMSWIPPLANSWLGRILDEITEPLLRPFRRFQIGGMGFGIDFSPIFAYFALYLIRIAVLPLIYSLLLRLGL